MARKLTLPLAARSAPATLDTSPTVEVVRKRLGGRASTEPGCGQVVAVGRAVGVVLFARAAQVDVWFEGDIVRRVERGEAQPVEGAVPAEVAAVAEDARTFAALGEGQAVCFERDGALHDGVLVEKCRFGALVELASGTVVGVAFRRVLPALTHRASPLDAG